MEEVKILLDPASGIQISGAGDIKVVAPTVQEQDEAQKIATLMQHTTYQARLGRKLDNINRKMLDNQIRLTSHPTDMLRISVKRDDISRDIISRQITNAEILPVVLPPLKNIPLRHFVRNGEDIQIPSLYTIQEQEYFEIYAPVSVKLEPDDLLVRIIYDSATIDPYVMILQVKEQLATMSYSSITMLKYFVTFYDQELPKTVIEAIKLMNLKRDKIGF